jgi:hypothetical protein
MYEVFLGVMGHSGSLLMKYVSQSKLSFEGYISNHSNKTSCLLLYILCKVNWEVNSIEGIMASEIIFTQPTSVLCSIKNFWVYCRIGVLSNNVCIYENKLPILMFIPNMFISPKYMDIILHIFKVIHLIF